MSTKAQDLLTKIGGNMMESIGVRAGEALVPDTKPAAKAPPAADFVRDRSVGEIDVDKVIPDPDQPRHEFDEVALDQLAQDIRSRGQLQPIRVRWSTDHGKWMIISGERRWRATQKAGLTKIKAIFIDRALSENEIRSEQLVENLLREGLTAIEEAKGYQGLMSLNGWSVTEVAAALHVSKAKVSRTLALLKLPEELQAKVEKGELAATAAYELAKVKDVEVQRTLAEDAADGQQTYADTRMAVKARNGEKSKRRKAPTNEIFRTGDGVRIVVSSRKCLGDAGILDALMEIVEQVRRRGKSQERKAA